MFRDFVYISGDVLVAFDGSPLAAGSASVPQSADVRCLLSIAKTVSRAIWAIVAVSVGRSLCGRALLAHRASPASMSSTRRLAGQLGARLRLAVLRRYAGLDGISASMITSRRRCGALSFAAAQYAIGGDGPGCRLRIGDYGSVSAVGHRRVALWSPSFARRQVVARSHVIAAPLGDRRHGCSAAAGDARCGADDGLLISVSARISPMPRGGRTLDRRRRVDFGSVSAWCRSIGYCRRFVGGSLSASPPRAADAAVSRRGGMGWFRRFNADAARARRRRRHQVRSILDYGRRRHVAH